MAQDRLVIGIDLGTTNSCVGVWLKDRVEIVPSDQGSRTTPSCVAFTDSERLIGEGANHQVATNASNTVFDMKRLIGRSFSDGSVKSDAKYWPFGVIAGPDDKPLIRVSYLGEEKGFLPEEMSAMVLVKMKETAEAYAGRAITDAVITVPAYFSSSQRQATKDAAAIAGLNVMRIINEPTAAAIAYSLNTKWKEGTVLFYDLGGGTLDVSLVVISKKGLRVIATAGDTHLGGEDFTNNMVDHFVNEFKMKNKWDISGDKKAVGRLRRSCEDGKKSLSTGNPRIRVEVYALFEGIDFHSEITREQFEELNKDLFRRCMEPVAKCLVEANMEKNKVDEVVLVGGSTRIPRVHKLVQDFFNGKVLCRNINADEAVAYGATIQAVMLKAPDPKEVLDITPFSLGIGIPEGIMWEVIERYTTIPTKKETPPFRVKDNQSSMDLMMYEDERAMANKFCIALDRKNKVQFEIDEDGILKVSVSAKHKEGWKTISNLVGCFSTAEMERMVEDAKKYKARDEEHKNNIHARNDIQNLLFTISNNMKNLEESAARLLFHSEATREQEKETRGFQNKCSKTRNSTGQVYKHHKAPANDTMKMLQARKDTIKKLPDSIKNLQVIADGTTQWLESKKLTTSDIIGRKMKIEGEYHNISSQIENVQAWNDIQNLLFTISNNMKNLEDSAARLHLQREPTREQEKETHVGYVIGIFWNQKSQDKNRKMIQAHKDTIKKLTDRIKNLQDMADKTTKSLESKNLTTGGIIEQKKRIEGEYNIIGSQIENVQARKDILNLLFTISNNMKNLEDSVARLHLHLEPTQEQEKETSRAVGGLSDDNDTKKMMQAHKDTIKKLTDTIENLHDGISRTIEWLESKKLTTSDIINEMKKIEGVYHYIISQIKNVQARNDIQNLVFTISNNMKNLEDSAASLLPNLGLTQEQEKGTPGYIRSSLPEKAEHKDDRKMIQAHNDIIKKLPDRIKNLQEIADGTAKWLENKKLTTSDITDQKWEIENEYHNILSQIESIYHIITNQTENDSH